MESLKIILFCIGVAVAYGMVHDQITARICVEYFTVGHPPIFNTDSPTLLGIGWGIVATWWVGLLLGVPLAFVARVGDSPKRQVGDLVRPAAILIMISALAACIAGVAGWRLAESGVVSLPAPWSQRVRTEKHAAFIADLFAHNASYGGGFVGGIVVCILVWRSRRQRTDRSCAAMSGPS